MCTAKSRMVSYVEVCCGGLSPQTRESPDIPTVEVPLCGREDCLHCYLDRPDDGEWIVSLFVKIFELEVSSCQ